MLKLGKMAGINFDWKKTLALCFFFAGAVFLTKPSNQGNCTGIDCPIKEVDHSTRSDADSMLHYPSSVEKSNSGSKEGSVSQLIFRSSTKTLGASPVRFLKKGPSTAKESPVTHSPRLSLILPRSVQRGKEHTLRFIGRNLGDADELFFYSDGFQFKDIKKVNQNQFTAKVTVKEDVMPGRHLIQVRTKTGVSDFRPVWISALPPAKEKEPNNQFAAPQKIPLNVSVSGVCTNEDIDYFQVECKKGQRLSVEISAMRLGSFLFDPYIAILDKNRFEIASSDDSSFAGQDGVCSVTIPEDGPYTIAVRESSFSGNPNCRYALHVGTFPRPTILYPAGGQVGTKTKVQLIGDPVSKEQIEITAPKTIQEDFLFLAKDDQGVSPSPNRFLLSPYPNSFQKEPNQYFSNATKVTFPSSVNGILEKPGDDDYFEFNAKKGKVWEIEVYAKRIGSPLDPLFHIWDSNRKYLLGNDDSRGQDSYVRFQVPKDGKYYFRVRDHLRRGGEDFVYRVEFRPAKPYVDISIPRTERYGQYRQTIFVPKGGRFGTVLMATKRNFSGPLEIKPEKLPNGVTVDYKPMPANMTRMPVVFSATKESELASVFVPLVVSHTDPKRNIKGVFQNKADMVLGPPNNAVYQSETVNRIPIAVIEEVPFDIEIVQPKSPIVRSGTKNLQIKVTRKNGFKGAVRVEFPFRPPGVGTRGSIQIPAGKTIGNYPLNANSNAQIASWPIYAIGSANISGGRAFSSSQLGNLTVASPFVTCTMTRVGVEQGKEVLLSCKLNQTTPFDGNATATLYGLPPGVTAEKQTFNKDAKEIIFKLVAKDNAKVGKHRGVFCQMVVPFEGENVVSRGGGTQLQVFKKVIPKKPAIKKSQPAAAPKKEVKKTQPAKKPLSRLQKLRLERKKKLQSQ